MADLAYTASAVVMTAFVLAVVGAVLRFGRWQSYSPTEPGQLIDRWNEVKSSPAAWTVVFLLLVFAFGGIAVLWVSGTSVPGAGILGILLAALAALVLGAYLFIGVYQAALSRGRPASQGVAEGAALLGLLIVLTIAVKLVM